MSAIEWVGQMGGGRNNLGTTESIVTSPKSCFDEVNEAVYFEVHILVDGKKLNALKYIK